MTASQITSAVGGTVAFVSGLTAALTPFVAFIPERHKPLAIAVLGLLAAVGGRLAQVNQSTSSDHISLPVGQAGRLVDAETGAPVNIEKHGGKL